MHSTQRSPRRGFLARVLTVAAVAALALPAASCTAVAGGVKDTVIDFPVIPAKNGNFFGWTEISVDAGPITVNKLTLLAVTLDVKLPAGTPDLSFLQSLKGEVVLGDQRTVLATRDKFPPGEQAVPLQIQFHEDLRPFFKDNSVIRLEWTGSTNPAFTAWPAEGFTVRGRIKVDIE